MSTNPTHPTRPSLPFAFDGEDAVELAEIIEHLLLWFTADMESLSPLYLEHNDFLLKLDHTTKDLQRLQWRLDKAVGRRS